MATKMDFGDGLTWRKSKRSDTNGECVYVAVMGNDTVGVRDSKEGSAGAIVRLAQADWAALAAAARA